MSSWAQAQLEFELNSLAQSNNSRFSPWNNIEFIMFSINILVLWGFIGEKKKGAGLKLTWINRD